MFTLLLTLKLVKHWWSLFSEVIITRNYFNFYKIELIIYFKTVCGVKISRDCDVALEWGDDRVRKIERQIECLGEGREREWNSANERDRKRACIIYFTLHGFWTGRVLFMGPLEGNGGCRKNVQPQTD